MTFRGERRIWRRSVIKKLKGFVPPRWNPWEDKWGPAACICLGPATETNLKKLELPDRISPMRGGKIYLFVGEASS